MMELLVRNAQYKDLTPSQSSPVLNWGSQWDALSVLSNPMLLWSCLALSEVMNCFQNREWERINYSPLNKNTIKNNSLHFSYYWAFLLSWGTMIFQGYHEFKVTLPLALWNRYDVHYPPLFMEEEPEAGGGPRAHSESQREPRSHSASWSSFYWTWGLSLQDTHCWLEWLLFPKPHCIGQTH